MKPLHMPLFVLQLTLLALGLLCVVTVNPQGLWKQALMTVTGVIITLVVSQLKPKLSIRLGMIGWVACAALLGAVLLIGNGDGSVNRWINLPGGYQLQPSEFTKIALIAYLASFFTRKGAGYKLWGPILVIAISTALILIAPSTSAAVFVFLLAMGVLFISGVNIGRVFAIAIAAGLVAYPAWVWQSSKHAYVAQRLSSFQAQQDGTIDENAEGYQVRVARTVINRGGIWGRGPDERKLTVPAQATDFIISTLGHTTGLIGITVVFAAFAGILYVGFSTASSVSSTTAYDPSERHGAAILASGAALLIVGQAVVNLGVVIGKLPNTGMALPMISEGGSSLVVCSIALGWIHAANAMLSHKTVSAAAPQMELVASD